MGLTIVVVIAATQLTGSGGQLRDISDATNSQGAVDALSGASCKAGGGLCYTDADAGVACATVGVQSSPDDCGTGNQCCK